MLGSLFMMSCSDNDDGVAKAVLASENYLNFKVSNNDAAIIDVFADGKWTTEIPQWITISHSTGEGSLQDVEISVADNIDSYGEAGKPRKDTLILRGDKLLSYCEIIVSQDGDKYKGIEPKTVSEIADIPVGDLVWLKDAQVVAKNESGLIISDGNKLMLVISEHSCEIGDILTIKGLRIEEHGLAAVGKVDNVKVESHSEPKFPKAKDITSNIDSYQADAYDYISFKGNCYFGENGNFTITPCSDEASTTLTILHPDASLGLDNLNGHIVSINAVVLSQEKNNINIIATSVIDEGVNEIIYIDDDFSWIKPFADKAKAEDSVGEDKNGYAPNIYTHKDIDTKDFLSELESKGYFINVLPYKDKKGEIHTEPEAVYLQKYYLKFGKGKYFRGLGVKLNQYLTDEPVDAILSFDWSTHKGGGGIDAVKLNIALENDGICANSNDKTSLDIKTTNKDVSEKVGKLEWQHVELVLKGITKNTTILINPAYDEDLKKLSGKDKNPEYLRFHLDNIMLKHLTE